MSRIKINNLKLSVYIGVFPHELVKSQKISLDIEIEYDDRIPSESDNIADALDYFKISEKITNQLESSRYGLIEKLNRDVIEIIMRDKKAIFCSVATTKYHCIENADSVTLVTESD